MESTKSCSKFATLRSFFKIFKKNFKSVKKIEKIQMYLKKLNNSFKMKQGYDT